MSESPKKKLEEAIKRFSEVIEAVKKTAKS